MIVIRCIESGGGLRDSNWGELGHDYKLIDKYLWLFDMG